jgi:hypothetical protein
MRKGRIVGDACHRRWLRSPRLLRRRYDPRDHGPDDFVLEAMLAATFRSQIEVPLSCRAA